jgi:hypothetical protein
MVEVRMKKQRPITDKDYKLARRVGRKFGKLGGRPRTVKHKPYDPKCRCVECRKAKEG